MRTRRTGPLAVRTAGGSGAVVGLVDVPRRPADGRAAHTPPRVCGRGAAACATRVPRENGAAWRYDGAARRLELVFQFLVFAPQPLALGFRPPQVLSQPLDLAALLVDDLLGIARRRRLVARHTVVMPKPRSKYK